MANKEIICPLTGLGCDQDVCVNNQIHFCDLQADTVVSLLIAKSNPTGELRWGKDPINISNKEAGELIDAGAEGINKPVDKFRDKLIETLTSKGYSLDSSE